MSVAQISASLQAALASAVGYTSSTTSAQVKQDLNSALANLTALNTSVQGLPSTGITSVQVLAIVPQGITLAVSAVRATSSVKGLSSPLTPEEGTAILAIVQSAKVQLVAMVNTYASKIPAAGAAEAAIPGISKYGLTTMKSVADPLIQALSAAAPSNTQQSTIQEIQSEVNVAIQNALSCIPA